ncbi:MAG: peptidase [Kordiimonadales bacterium]|nr:MAG: peptidase [Kordiimonadales bacterium]
MSMDKRQFLKFGAAGVGVAALAACGPEGGKAATQKIMQSTGSALKNITGDSQAITVEERKARVAKAQKLMAEFGIDALVLEPGSAMLYFTGIRWRRSERLTAVVIPREGDIGIVAPFFEEPSVRESMTFGDDVRPWHEHESPFELVASILADRGLKGGKIGLEDTVRYFVVKGLQQAAPSFEIMSGLAVTQGCRMFKSQAELALMRKASEVTMGAFADVWPKLEVGMTPRDISGMMGSAQRSLGGSGAWGLVLLAEASAYPHGTGQPQTLKNGDIVLMDCGCKVHGYQSDISRTFVFGEPTKRQREVWDTVRRGQQIAFETAQLGTPAGAVDDAARKYYESLGYGPGYKTPGLSHRTGHGIGMDGHESVNFVHGEKTLLEPGMCFSNEPGLYIYGEFGVRLEDCIYMGERGPEWFTVPPESLDDPLGRMG